MLHSCRIDSFYHLFRQTCELVGHYASGVKVVDAYMVEKGLGYSTATADNRLKNLFAELVTKRCLTLLCFREVGLAHTDNSSENVQAVVIARLNILYITEVIVEPIQREALQGHWDEQMSGRN